MDILEKLKDRSLRIAGPILTEAIEEMSQLRRDREYYEYMIDRLAKLFAAKGDTPREIISEVHFRAQGIMLGIDQMVKTIEHNVPEMLEGE